MRIAHLISRLPGGHYSGRVSANTLEEQQTSANTITSNNINTNKKQNKRYGYQGHWKRKVVNRSRDFLMASMKEKKTIECFYLL